MLDAKTRDALTRKEVVSYYLRTLALKVDPMYGHLTALAEELDVHSTTLSSWIAQGYVPEFQCKKLHKRFGDLAPLDDLCPAEFRS